VHVFGMRFSETIGVGMPDHSMSRSGTVGRHKSLCYGQKKNWLFSDTTAGAKASATIYSLMLTCRACGVDPHDWLAHVLAELPQRGPEADIEDLFPFNFAANDAPATENTS
jgi:hypothetical protein